VATGSVLYDHRSSRPPSHLMETNSRHPSNCRPTRGAVRLHHVERGMVNWALLGYLLRGYVTAIGRG
jgi:hypothetical protein